MLYLWYFQDSLQKSQRSEQSTRRIRNAHTLSLHINFISSNVAIQYNPAQNNARLNYESYSVSREKPVFWLVLMFTLKILCGSMATTISSIHENKCEKHRSKVRNLHKFAYYILKNDVILQRDTAFLDFQTSSRMFACLNFFPFQIATVVNGSQLFSLNSPWSYNIRWYITKPMIFFRQRSNVTIQLKAGLKFITQTASYKPQIG